MSTCAFTASLYSLLPYPNAKTPIPEPKSRYFCLLHHKGTFPNRNQGLSGICCRYVLYYFLLYLLYYLSLSLKCSPPLLRMAVPIPLLVNISRSRQCGILPSIICTLETPFSTASMQLLSFGNIPPPIYPSLISSCASSRSSSEISVPGSSLSRYTPSISVRKASFSALTAFAMAHAASSALTL